MNVNVWTAYRWECSKCNSDCEASYQPEIGAKLPTCEFCGKQDTCEGITEDVRPEPPKKKRSRR